MACISLKATVIWQWISIAKEANGWRPCDWMDPTAWTLNPTVNCQLKQEIYKGSGTRCFSSPSGNLQQSVTASLSARLLPGISCRHERYWCKRQKCNQVQKAISCQADSQSISNKLDPPTEASPVKTERRRNLGREKKKFLSYLNYDFSWGKSCLFKMDGNNNYSLHLVGFQHLFCHGVGLGTPHGCCPWRWSGNDCF